LSRQTTAFWIAPSITVVLKSVVVLSEPPLPPQPVSVSRVPLATASASPSGCSFVVISANWLWDHQFENNCSEAPLPLVQAEGIAHWFETYRGFRN